MPYLLAQQLSNLELQPGWQKLTGPTINPKVPDGYYPVQLPSALRLFCVGSAYSGWLAKQVNPLLTPAAGAFTTVLFSYLLTVDSVTASNGQVVETDTKITDPNGWTADLSFQWNILEKWRAQVVPPAGSGWVDTAVALLTLPQPGVPVPVTIQAKLDHVNHVSTIVSVNGTATNAAQIPMRQAGWTPNQIVTQLQQCISGVAYGAYSVEFAGINYSLF